MNIKERSEQLWWDWLQSIGKARFIRQCIFTGSLYCAVMLYPWLAGIDLALGLHGAAASFPDLPGLLASLTSSGLGGWVGGVVLWNRLERKHRTASIHPAAD